MKSMTQCLRTMPTGEDAEAAIAVDREPANLEAQKRRPGLRLNFRRERLETVLEYLYCSTGLFIHVEPEVEVGKAVDLVEDRPVSPAEAVQLLRKVLVGIGCTLIQKGSLFCVIRSQDVKKNYIPLPALA